MSSIQGLKAPAPPPPPRPAAPKPEPVKAEPRETASQQRVDTARGQRQAAESQAVSNGSKVGTRLNVTA